MIRRTLLTLVLTLATVAQAAPPSLPEIDRYRGLLHFLQVSETPQSMQPLFDAAGRAVGGDAHRRQRLRLVGARQRR